MKRNQKKKAEHKEHVLKAVKENRKDFPKMGAICMHHLLKQDDIKVGRVKLIRWLRESNLMNPRKRKSSKTTNTLPNTPKYPDLRVNLKPERIEQLWVSDITYVRTKTGFAYVCLLTDVYSRKVMGCQVRKTLHKELVISTIEEGLAGRKTNGELIIHSDRGCQYTSNAYIELLEGAKVKISHTQTGSPYDNAIAERLNGIFKQYFEMGKTFETIKEVETKMKRNVRLYNERRPHQSLGYKTPEYIYTANQAQLLQQSVV